VSKARVRRILAQSRADIARLDAEQDRLLARDADREARAKERAKKGHRASGKYRDGDLFGDDVGGVWEQERKLNEEGPSHRKDSRDEREQDDSGDDSDKTNKGES